MKNNIINHLVFYCGNVKRNDKVFLIYDSSTKKIYNKFKNFLNKKKINFESSLAKKTNNHGNNLGKKIGDIMKKTDITFCLTKNSFAHSKERLSSENRGKKFLSLVNYNSKKIDYNSILAPFKRYSLKAKKLKKILDKSEKIKINTNNGTNLITEIKNRKANFCPGYVNNKILLGSPPDVETNISPIEKKSFGNIEIDGSISTEAIGKLNNNKIKLVINNGEIIKFETKNNVLKKKFGRIFLNKNKKRRVLAEIGFGFNKKSKITGHMLCDEGAYGCVHFGFGSNFTVGGKNKVNFHLDMTIKKPIVYIDNKLILKNNRYNV